MQSRNNTESFDRTKTLESLAPKPLFGSARPMLIAVAMGTLIFCLEGLGVWLCAGFVLALCLFPAPIDTDSAGIPTGIDSGDSNGPETSSIPPRTAR